MCISCWQVVIPWKTIKQFFRVDAKGKVTYWICELGTAAQYSGFKSFVQDLKSRDIQFNQQTKTLTYNGNTHMRLSMERVFIG